MARESITEIKALAEKTCDRDDFLKEVARAINRHFPHYNWIGYYFLKAGKLHVGPYIGKPTPHTVIELDKGICGAAVSQGETVVVDDVSTDPRYLACSLETRSEIVIPIRVRGKIIGELDIDSSQPAAFGPVDRQLLEEIVRIIEARLELEQPI